jgi:hypothetical protein
MREYASGPSQRLDTNVFANIANNVRYSPLELPHASTAYGIIVMHGAVAAGNLYVALYDSLNYAPNNRLAVSANTVASGTNRLQYVPFATPVSLAAGLYFTALIANPVADTYLENSDNDRMLAPANINNGLAWYVQNLGAYLIPPAVAVPVMATTVNQTVLMRLRVAAI